MGWWRRCNSSIGLLMHKHMQENAGRDVHTYNTLPWYRRPTEYKRRCITPATCRDMSTMSSVFSLRSLNDGCLAANSR